jgi:hypothetical protein
MHVVNFFVHVVEYVIIITILNHFNYKNDQVIIHQWMSSRLDDICSFHPHFQQKS